MQIQQSLCLVYRRDLLIQSLKEIERERETDNPTIDANIQCVYKGSHQQPNQWFSLEMGNEGCRAISWLFHSLKNLYIYSGEA